MSTAADLITRLRRDVRGRVITPDQPEEYAVARRVEAGSPDVSPLAVVRVRDTADVQAVVHTAREAGVRLAVRGGGHSAAAHGTVEGGLVLDTSGLTDLVIDARARTARAGGLGLLSRLYGMTIDALLAAEVVTADGRVHEVDADHDPDLFWALRGGGGNFGWSRR